MKVLLLGGTGVMGSSLSKMLKKRGVELYITTRTNRSSNGLVHYIQGNAMEDSFVSVLCKSHHYDAIVDFMSYKTKQFRERIGLFLNATEQYVYISTGRVYGHEEYPIKESSPRLLDCSNDLDFLSTDEYALAKARQEDILKQSGKTNYTIIRPCIIYGEERFQLGVLEKEEWLYRALHGREIIFCKEILDRTTTMTHGDDVARAFVNIIGNVKCLGETYHITCNHHRTWQQIFNIYKSAIKDITGINIKMKLVSLEDFMNSRPNCFRYQVICDRVFDKKFDVAKLTTIIDVDSFVPPEDGLYQSITHFINGGKNFKYIPVMYEAKRDKLVHTYTTLFDISGWKEIVKYIIYRVF